MQWLSSHLSCSCTDSYSKEKWLMIKLLSHNSPTHSPIHASMPGRKTHFINKILTDLKPSVVLDRLHESKHFYLLWRRISPPCFLLSMPTQFSFHSNDTVVIKIHLSAWLWNHPDFYCVSSSSKMLPQLDPLDLSPAHASLYLNVAFVTHSFCQK